MPTVMLGKAIVASADERDFEICIGFISLLTFQDTLAGFKAFGKTVPLSSVAT